MQWNVTEMGTPTHIKERFTFYRQRHMFFYEIRGEKDENVACLDQLVSFDVVLNLQRLLRTWRQN